MRSTTLDVNDVSGRAWSKSPVKPSMAMGEDRVWEMYDLPPNVVAEGKKKHKAERASMVMTPRTTAFNILGGGGR